MRARAFIAALIVASSLDVGSSVAACHHYSYWAYNGPQRCGVVGSPQVRGAVARVAAREEEPMPAPLPVGLRKPDIPLTVPTLPPPPKEWNDLILRAMGIDELKKKLAHER
jgi:hypothetical protein